MRRGRQQEQQVGWVAAVTPRERGRVEQNNNTTPLCYTLPGIAAAAAGNWLLATAAAWPWLTYWSPVIGPIG